MTCLANHPQKNVIRLQLTQNVVLQGLNEEDRAQLEPHLVIVDGNRGEFLLQQGVREMEQYFILEGILKRVVANKEGQEMILGVFIGSFASIPSSWIAFRERNWLRT
jgi:CRP/FNR family transcriptional regulator, dissimilatory nitrate respiration regulator